MGKWCPMCGEAGENLLKWGDEGICTSCLSRDDIPQLDSGRGETITVPWSSVGAGIGAVALAASNPLLAVVVGIAGLLGIRREVK